MTEITHLSLIKLFSVIQFSQLKQIDFSEISFKEGSGEQESIDHLKAKKCLLRSKGLSFLKQYLKEKVSFTKN